MYVYLVAAAIAYAIFFWKSKEEIFPIDPTFLDLRPLVGVPDETGQLIFFSERLKPYKVGPYDYVPKIEEMDGKWVLSGWWVFTDGGSPELKDAWLTRDGIQHLLIERG